MTGDAKVPGNDPSGKDAGGDKPVDDAGGDDGPPPTGCNMTGKWVVTEHFAMTGINAEQTVWNWFYVEIGQSGSQLTFQKSLSCGARVVGSGFEIEMDDSQAWPSYTMRPAYAGRKGAVEKVAEGCMVSFEKDAVVRGATIEAYRDPAVPLPKKAQMAMDGTPGWEDWDEDGEPGVTLNIKGIVEGKLYAAMRNWTTYEGVVEDGADLMKLGIDWGQTRSTLGYTSPIFTADAAKDPDASKSFVEFGRLTDEQAAGDDLTICESVRTLAPMLTPNASME